MKKQKILKRGFQLFGILILFIFISTIDYQKAKEALSLLNLEAAIELFLLMLFLIVLKGIRWKYIIKSLTGEDIPLYFSSISIVCGVAAGSLVPGRLDVAKPLMLKNHYGVDLKRSTSGMLIERLADIQSIVILFVISIGALIFSGLNIQKIFLLILLVFPVVLLSLYFYPRKIHKILTRMLKRIPIREKFKVSIQSFMDELFDSLEQINNKKTLSALILISIGCMMIEVIRLYVILEALNIDISFLEVSFVFFAAVLIGIISLVPGAIGIYEVSSTELVKSVSDSPDISIIKSAVLIDRVIAYYVLVILGGIFISSQRYLFKDGETE